MRIVMKKNSKAVSVAPFILLVAMVVWMGSAECVSSSTAPQNEVASVLSSDAAVDAEANDGGVVVSDDGQSTPWFYHGLEGPGFKEVATEGNYSVRVYGATSWVATTISGKGMEKAGNEGFMRLFRYISGENERKQKIEMTVPVLVTVTPAQGPFCEDNFTYHFFMPEEFQDDPPKPTNPDVFLDNQAGMTVAVASYSGFSNEKKVAEHGSKLFAELEEDKQAFNDDTYFWAGYDSPFRLINRHNEVWVKLTKFDEA